MRITIMKAGEGYGDRDRVVINDGINPIVRVEFIADHVTVRDARQKKKKSAIRESPPVEGEERD